MAILEESLYLGSDTPSNHPKEPGKKSKSSKLLPVLGLICGIQSAAIIVSAAMSFSLSDQLSRANHRFEESLIIGKQLMSAMDLQSKTIELQQTTIDVQHDTIKIQQQTISLLRGKS